MATSIYCEYRSPNLSQPNDEKLLEWMRRREGRYVMCGDFNYPGIKWDEGRSDAKGRDFLEVIQSKFMWQHVSVGTHTSGNTLDLVISSTESLVGELALEGRLGSSDHELLKFLVDVEVSEEKNNVKKRDFGKANWEGMRRKLDIDWRSELEGKNTNETWEFIEGKIHEAMEENVP